MFKENYSLEMIISAVVTMAAILLCVRLYLKIINRKSKIQKPDWLGEEFDKKFKMKGK
ncbi:hypothetical protein [Helicobacter sp. 23-1045]